MSLDDAAVRRRKGHFPGLFVQIAASSYSNTHVIFGPGAAPVMVPAPKSSAIRLRQTLLATTSDSPATETTVRLGPSAANSTCTRPRISPPAEMNSNVAGVSRVNALEGRRPASE